MTNWSEYFDCDFEAGVLTWKSNRPLSHFKNEHGMRIWQTQRGGHIAGSASNSEYLIINIMRKRTLVHRVIYEMKYGPIPVGMEIDHIDGVRTNNSISNLRLSTRMQNAWNGGHRSSNKTGYKGVGINKKTGMFRAAIMVRGKNKFLGHYSDVRDAAAAYEKAATEAFGEFKRSLDRNELLAALAGVP